MEQGTSAEEIVEALLLEFESAFIPPTNIVTTVSPTAALSPSTATFSPTTPAFTPSQTVPTTAPTPV